LHVLPGVWLYRGNVIPASAGMQSRGAAGMPACTGMTTPLTLLPYRMVPVLCCKHNSIPYRWLFLSEKSEKNAWKFEN
jgi:hypothetical protein